MKKIFFSLLLLYEFVPVQYVALISFEPRDFGLCTNVLCDIGSNDIVDYDVRIQTELRPLLHSLLKQNLLLMTVGHNWDRSEWTSDLETSSWSRSSLYCLGKAFGNWRNIRKHHIKLPLYVFLSISFMTSWIFPVATCHHCIRNDDDNTTLLSSHKLSFSMKCSFL